jgi:restriction system protein
MLGHGALGEFPLGGASSVVEQIERSKSAVALSVSALFVPDKRLIVAEQKVAEGRLVSSTSVIWTEMAKRLASDWSLAQQLSPEQWEEMVAGAFKNQGYDEVIITPRSGDFGRDIIATKHGVGSVRILGSVKAYQPGNLVPYDAVRALAHVVAADQRASKGILTTTSDFPPKITEDPGIAPFLPTRLELVNGKQLQQWLGSLTQSSGS